MRHPFSLIAGLFLTIVLGGLAPGKAATATIQPGVQAVDLFPTSATKIGFSSLPTSTTGVTFTNVLTELASAENRVLNNGSGVAAGDYDGDGWVDLFFCSLNNTSSLYRNLGNWRFEQVTSAAGLRFKPGPHRGAVFSDVDGDGRLDLLITTVSEGVLCFTNRGHGAFGNATVSSGLAGTNSPSTLALADMDGNGTLDLYVCNLRRDDIRDMARVPMMSVNGQPTVPPQLRNRLIFSDGQLLEFGEADTLYLNDGRGSFKSVSWTEGAFLNEEGQPVPGSPRDWGLTAAFRDINGDGHPDLYVCNDFWTPDRIWLNTGDGRLRILPRLHLRKTSSSSMGIDFADINRDGHMDFFVVDMLGRTPESRKRQHVSQPNRASIPGEINTRPQSARNTLFLNQGDGSFAEVAHLAGLAATDWSWSPVFLDVDLDGYEDLIITTGHIRDIQDLDATRRIQLLQDSWRRTAPPGGLEKAFVEAKKKHMEMYPKLDTAMAAFRNRGDLRFEDKSADWGLTRAAVQHGLAVADLDGDGDLDMVCSRLGSEAGLFRNESPAPRVAVRLRGRSPNTQAIGARIELMGGPVPNQRQEVVAGGSYLSGSDPLRVFATGGATNGLNLRVTWRDGTMTEIPNVKPNYLYEVAEEKSDRSRSSPAIINQRITPMFEDVSEWLGHSHFENPSEAFQRQPLLPYKTDVRGPGVTWFDINRDGWEDLILPTGKGGKLAVFLSRSGTSFSPADHPLLQSTAPGDQTTILGWNRGKPGTALLIGSTDDSEDATKATGTRVLDWTGGRWESPLPGGSADSGALALADIDGDGDLDLFAGGLARAGKYPIPGESRLFRGVHTGWSHDIEASAVLAGVGLVNGAVWSDLDGDGFPELILACEWGPVRVFHNDSGKSFREITGSLGLAQHTGLWTGVTTGDLDQDGRMDVIAGNHGWNTSLRADSIHPAELYFGDFLGIGRTDLLEAEHDPILERLVPRARRELLFPALPFLEGAFPTHLAYSRASIAELLQSIPGKATRLTVSTLATTVFLNRGDHFVAQPLPIEAQFAPVHGVNVADLDGDGLEDVFLSQNFFGFRNEESRLDAGRGLWLRGDGRGGFAPVSAEDSGIRVYGEQRGSAVADMDHDGRSDLVVTQNGAATRLLRNIGGKPGLRVKLQGPQGNPDGIGAVVRVKFPTHWSASHELHSGSGYWSMDGTTRVIGLPEIPLSIEVRWPGGRISREAVGDLTTTAPEKTIHYPTAP